MFDTTDEDVKSAVAVAVTVVAAALFLKAFVIPRAAAPSPPTITPPARSVKTIALKTAPPASFSRFAGTYEGKFRIGSHVLLSKAGRAHLRVSPAGAVTGYGYQAAPGAGSGMLYLWAGMVDGAGSVHLVCGRIGAGRSDGTVTGPLRKDFSSKAGPVDAQCTFSGQTVVAGGRATISLSGMDCDGREESIEVERQNPR
ncbi:MAG: hypothetical protein IT209_09410 [Armatimonadetes bacterium]|nr:hypothetical protein [Armatimonadota bacterium]